jgi:hypothetical protein
MKQNQQTTSKKTLKSTSMNHKDIQELQQA